MGLIKFIGNAGVVYGVDCLFGIGPDGIARWGVRQQVVTNAGEIEWYHHSWGINNEADARDLADRINKGEIP